MQIDDQVKKQAEQLVNALKKSLDEADYFAHEEQDSGYRWGPWAGECVRREDLYAKAIQLKKLISNEEKADVVGDSTIHIQHHATTKATTNKSSTRFNAINNHLKQTVKNLLMPYVSCQHEQAFAKLTQELQQLQCELNEANKHAAAATNESERRQWSEEAFWAECKLRDQHKLLERLNSLN